MNEIKIISWFKDFILRQTRNFKVLLTGNMVKRFFGDLTMQYRQVYIRLLGASSVELGFVNSLSSIVHTILAIPTGLLLDKYSLKKLIIIGQIMSIFVPLIFLISLDWRFIVFAAVWDAATIRVSMPASFTANLASLDNSERAMGSGLNSALTSLTAMLASLIGAFLVVNFGGLTIDGIRPLFIIQILGSISALLILFFLKDIRLRSEKRTTGFIKDMIGIFKLHPQLKLACLMNVVKMSSMQLLFTFTTVYLVEKKNADAPILGLMMAIATVIVLVFALPFGKISDRYGRKKIIYILAPMTSINFLIILFAPSPEYLLLSSIFDGFGRILMEVVWSTFMFELIPLEAHGRWIGIMDLLIGIEGVIMPILGGILYEIAPNCIFYIGIITELAIIPIIYAMHERSV